MKEYYPAPAEETIQYNSLLHGSRIFGSVNTNSMGEEYIEIVFHEELFYGAAGCGAWRNKKPIHTADITDLKEAVISFGSSPYEKERAKELFPLFEKIFTNCADFRRSGSAALDMCYVACGRLHGYIERNLKPWDYAAGTVILKEAGGIVEGWEKEALPYLFNADVLCSVPGIRDSLKSFL